MRVILDTNVLLGALISPHGPPDAIYRAWRAARFELVTSRAQLDELRRVSRYPKLKTILPAHRILDQPGTAEDRKPSWWQRLLGGLGIQYHHLGRDKWVLHDAVTTDWALATHGALGARVWSIKK